MELAQTILLISKYELIYVLCSLHPWYKNNFIDDHVFCCRWIWRHSLSASQQVGGMEGGNTNDSSATYDLKLDPTTLDMSVVIFAIRVPCYALYLCCTLR